MKKLKGLFLVFLGIFMALGFACCTPADDGSSGSSGGSSGDVPPRENSVAAARLAEDGAVVRVENAVVAKITYATGMNPSGFYLVDDTQSIYVYDSELAATVQVGDTVTISGEKDYWVLTSEQAAAEKHGYKGCNQLTNVELISCEHGNTPFDRSWIQESTVKAMMENPKSNDITTTIFKVNALVEKRVGTDFVNYYFFDIDGITGSYTYSQCDGADYAWVDPFDGKICTVYLSALNAKSTNSECFYRFAPIAIEDNNYTFNVNDAAKYAVEYKGVGQFQATYNADPATELITNVSSELLGFENATLSYASDNTSVIYFAEEGGKTVLHCGTTYGTANVTVTGAYNGVTYSETLMITYEEGEQYPSITVAQAIALEPSDDTIIVKGIVGPSLVNKNGFYLFGDDGSMIAVVVNSTDMFNGIAIGNEIILQGRRENHKDDSKGVNRFGQTCIMDAELLVNNYGTHEYSTAKFVTDKTLADFYALDVTQDYTTTVFVVRATVEIIETPYYTAIKIKSGSTTASLYCASAGQYSWLKPYAGQEVTMELAACNWNDKTYYAGCVLAVRTDNGKVLNELNFQSNNA